ncbi:hypothetical protein [Archaeoglobus veneficus]|uniref:hypothetical protein n=1 Tax=Archaeoglobus veneficus TaxID=58290 RepID=UPI0012E9F511|nr:hypothetical protein [Archaeoglobus veneficus]
MGLVEDIMEAIISIFIVIVFFFWILPEFSKISGISPLFIWFLGILLIVAIILSILKS